MDFKILEKYRKPLKEYNRTFWIALLFGVVMIVVFYTTCDFIQKFKEKRHLQTLEKANIFLKQKNLDSAIVNFNKSSYSQNELIELNSFYGLAESYYLKFGIDDTDSCERYLNFITYRTPHHTNKASFAVYKKAEFLKAQISIEKKQFDVAELSYQKVIDSGITLKDSISVIEALTKMVVLYDKQEKISQIVSIANEFNDYSDAINPTITVELLNVVIDIVFKYNIADDIIKKFTNDVKKDEEQRNNVDIGETGHEEETNFTFKNFDKIIDSAFVLTHDTILVINTLNNFGKIFTLASLYSAKQEYLDSNKIFFEQAISLSKAMKNEELLNKSIYSLGEYYLQAESFDSLSFLYDSIIPNRNWSDFDRAKIINIMASMYCKQKKYVNSLYFLNHVDTLLQGVILTDRIDSLQFYRLLVQQQENYANVLQYLGNESMLRNYIKKYRDVLYKKDSLETFDRFADFGDLILKYKQKYDELKKLQNENRDIKIDKTVSIFFNIVIILLLLVVIIFVGFAVWVFLLYSKEETYSSIYEKFYITKEKNKIFYSDVIYIEKKSNSDKVIFHTKKGEFEEYNALDMLIAGNTEKGIKPLPSKLFIRVHQSFIVNILECKQILTGSKDMLMSNDKIVPIARERKSKVLEEYNYQEPLKSEIVRRIVREEFHKIKSKFNFYK